MKSIPLRKVVVVGFVWSIMTFRKAQVAADSDNPGVISIDCGVIRESVDENGFTHQADDAEFGQIKQFSPDCSFNYTNQEQNWQQMNTLRNFPLGKRNCYSLTPQQGKSNSYLIRAYFAIDSCHNKSSAPDFDVHLGVNLWTRINWDSTSDQIQRKGVVVHQVSPTSNIDVCLIDTGHGIPFISLLEVWPSSNSIYLADTNRLPLGLLERNSLGLPRDHPNFIRYPDDPYGRAWFSKQVKNSDSFDTQEAIDDDASDYKLPHQVLKTAIRSRIGSFSLVINLNYSADYEYYVYLHFFNFDELRPQNQLTMDINIADTINRTIILDQRKVKTFIGRIQNGKSLNQISITTSPDSGFRPMINAYEVYRVLPQPNRSTNGADANAMRQIKEAYKIRRISWQGDPCMPQEFKWDGVTCDYSENIPRVTKLDLSSSNLKGEITTAFSNLTRLESLDLSKNQLTGKIPKSLAAALPNLKLNLDGNPHLCTGSCNKTITKKSIIAIATSVATSVTVLIICIYVMLYKRRRNKEIGTEGNKMGQLKSKDRAFGRAEICSITNNFEIVIGEGGFGRVYYGKLQDGTQVAIKLLSKSSQQGFKEFQSEVRSQYRSLANIAGFTTISHAHTLSSPLVFNAELLTIVHHKNLVSLIGYCDYGDMKALVYEYMTEGNLRYILSDKSQYVLKWNERLQIALDAACGLDYLHNGCKPPIIHRDLKTSNILLGQNMQAKISDFGLSRAFASESDTCVSSQAAGTIGYLDPEFHCSGNLNKKSDVYSFGIILLELVTGRPAVTGTCGNTIHIYDWVTPKLENGDIKSIMDPRLEGKFNAESAWKFLEIAMSCVPPTAIQRPDISHVVNELKECFALELSLGNAEGGANGRMLNTTLDISYVSLGSDLSNPYAR